MINIKNILPTTISNANNTINSDNDFKYNEDSYLNLGISAF